MAQDSYTLAHRTAGWWPRLAPVEGDAISLWLPGAWGSERKDGWDAWAVIAGVRWVLHVDRPKGPADEYDWVVRRWGSLELADGRATGRHTAMLAAEAAIGVDPAWMNEPGPVATS